MIRVWQPDGPPFFSSFFIFYFFSWGMYKKQCLLLQQEQGGGQVWTLLLPCGRTLLPFCLFSLSLSLFPLILPHSTDLGARAPPREGTPAGKREKEPPAKTPVCNSGKFSSSSSSSHSLSLLLLPSPISYMIRFFLFPSLPLSPALLFLQWISKRKQRFIQTIDRVEKEMETNHLRLKLGRWPGYAVIWFLYWTHFV